LYQQHTAPTRQGEDPNEHTQANFRVDLCGIEGCPGDAKITEKVQAALNQHADLGPPDSIRVQTLNHVVYLNGLVDDGLAKRSAVAITKQVAGVATVVNNIAVTNE
jgi:osmotically-inducible protein OsmY